MRTFDEAIELVDPLGEISEVHKASAVSDKESFLLNPTFVQTVRELSEALIDDFLHEKDSAQSEIYATVAGAIHLGIEIGRVMEREDLPSAETPVRHETEESQL